MKLIILFTALTVFNVIIQTVKSLCTVRCSTFISACVNALAYGLYTYVIFFTTSEGMLLWSKAVITAVANFFGVYVANYIFDRFFSQTVRWKIEVSIPNELLKQFEGYLNARQFEWCYCGWGNNWTNYAVFCPDKNASAALREILPLEAKYNVVECVKRL
jgi:hypothetical protein